MPARYEIRFSEGVKEELGHLRVYDRRILLDTIESRLTHVPNKASRQCKLLHNLVPPFEAIPPIWQLRVGVFRVFYDVNDEEGRVYVRAVRRKPMHLKTEEIL